MPEIISVCSRCDTPLEHGDLRCSICGQSSPPNETTKQNVSAKILRCKGCGAAVAFDPEHQALRCSFCDGIVEIETIIDPMEQTEAYLPFLLTPDDAQRALRQWLGSLGWFRPSDLTSASHVDDLHPLYWVAWVFDTECKISWAADSNANSRRSSWAPHSGQTDVVFQNILVSASRGLSQPEAVTVSRRLDLRTAQATPNREDGVTREQFDVQRSQARRQVRDALRLMAKKHVEETQIPGSSFRNVHVETVVKGLTTRRLSLPAYVMAYRYHDQLFRVVISGQNAKDLTGTAPYSTAKIVLTICGAIALALLFLVVVAAAQ
ncbi:hypothetical protein [Rhodopirellula baltica]|uniref:Primosomal protein N' (Replication factor Y)-superfamily II helicase n=1 Tax=Rhodopirellula baltica WH47 TaxID=991778 RepID=F2ALV4_RHOBT|nr:hypothetical protein [Rhodopirellula baltica]EGF29326.1 hypothetical protein RBWH47_04755 [Rhodopirellula baltica WH47]